MKERIVEMAVYIDQDMREIAKEVNKQKNKANTEELTEWAKRLLADVEKFCSFIDDEYKTDIL